MKRNPAPITSDKQERTRHKKGAHPNHSKEPTTAKATFLMSSNNKQYPQLPSVRDLVPTTPQAVGTPNNSIGKKKQNYVDVHANFARPQKISHATSSEEQEEDERSSVLNFACQECRRAHKACSKTRPCSRCAKHGLACGSIHRKKRVGKIITPNATNINTASPIIQSTVAAVSRTLQQQQSIQQQQYQHNVPQAVPQFQIPQISVQAVPFGSSSILVPPQMPTWQQQQQLAFPPPNENFASLHAYQSPNTMENLEQPIAYRRFVPASEYDTHQVPRFHFNPTLAEQQHVTITSTQQQPPQQQKELLPSMMVFKLPQATSTHMAQGANYQQESPQQQLQQLPSIRSLDEWKFPYNPTRSSDNDWQ